MAGTEKKRDEKKKKVKRPSALKRKLQSDKRRLANRSFKATVRTAIRGLKEAVLKKEGDSAQTKLQTVYSLMDKGVKKGIFKKNKADRTKSRLAQTVV
jgi:small subunit ribosomal protein S20